MSIANIMKELRGFEYHETSPIRFICDVGKTRLTFRPPYWNDGTTDEECYFSELASKLNLDIRVSKVAEFRFRNLWKT